MSTTVGVLVPYCRMCGTEVNEAAKFCEECGAGQPTLGSNEPATEQSGVVTGTQENARGRGWYITGWVSGGVYGLWLVLGVALGKFDSIPGVAFDILLQPILWLSVASFVVARYRTRGTSTHSWMAPLAVFGSVTAIAVIAAGVAQSSEPAREAPVALAKSSAGTNAKVSIRDRIQGISVPPGKFFLCSTRQEVLSALGEPTSSTDDYAGNEVMLFVGLDGSESRVHISTSGLVLSYDSTDPLFPAGAEAVGADPSIGVGASMAQVVSMYGTPHAASPSCFMYSSRETGSRLEVMVLNFDDRGLLKSVRNPL